jgi:hypothetical protein
MTSFRIEHLESGSTRATRAVRFTREQAQDQLAGRTIWSSAATPGTSITQSLDIPADANGVQLGAAERALCTQAAEIVTAQLARDDIVLLHDSVSMLLAMAIREHGAHTVWVMSGGSLPALKSAFDAFIATWQQAVAALLPCSGAITVKTGPDAELDWNSALTDVVDGDRQEMVGGTHHARPAVAPR